MESYYTASILMSAVLMLCMCLCVDCSGVLSRDSKIHFYVLFTIIAIASGCEWMGQYLRAQGNGEGRALLIFVKMTEFSLAPFVGVLVSDIIRHTTSRRGYLLAWLHALIELFNAFWGFIFSVSESCEYVHEDGYWIYVVAFLLSILYAIFCMIRAARRSQYQGVPFLVSIVCFVIMGLWLQYFFDGGIRVIWLVLAVGCSLLYVFSVEMIQQTDVLTGLINRRGYEAQLTSIEHKATIVMMDLDGLKEVNDSFGHPCGDECLKCLAHCIRSVFGRVGRCFRVGGDEFCVIITQDDTDTQGLIVAFEEKVKSKVTSFGRMPSVSVGQVSFDPGCDILTDVIKRADERMYQMKSDHKRAQTKKETKRETV